MMELAVMTGASGIGTGGSGSSMNRGPRAPGAPRVVGPQKNFRQDS